MCKPFWKLVLEALNDELSVWQHHYNWERVHGGIGPAPIDKLHNRSSQTPFWDEVIERYDVTVEAAKVRQKQRQEYPKK